MITRRTLLHRMAISIPSLAVLPLAGCGGDDDKNVTTIRMTDALVYDPNVVRIKSGGTVRWQNTGNVPHSVTTQPEILADPSLVLIPGGVEPWDSGLIQAGASWEMTFTTPGEYRYACLPHEAVGMTGILIVES